jgi:hypothetical protein
MSTRPHLVGLLVAGALAVACLGPGGAQASDTIFWTVTYNADEIYAANLDGSSPSPAVVNTTGATVSEPWGVAPDPAGGRVYWANYGAGKISWANLDGSGGDDLDTGAATLNLPFGLVVDHAANKVYWANTESPKISWANLDGSGGGDLDTGAATVDGASGLAIDTVQGRIYWANYDDDSIAYANLDGSGGGDLNVGSAPINQPWGVTIDTATRRIFWGNFGTDEIGVAGLDVSDSGAFASAGAVQSNPVTGSIDPTSGRLYWANYGLGGIMFANADGTGAGGTLYPTDNEAGFLAIMRAPAGAAPPAIQTSPPAARGKKRTLSCSQGEWRADLLGEQLYWAPQSFAYQWTRNSKPVNDAATNTLKANKPGDYACTVTATNAAGSTPQTSAEVALPAKPNTKITKAKIGDDSATFKFKARKAKAKSFQCRLSDAGKHKQPRFKRCDSPQAYDHLADGRYLFEVRAVGAAGKDPSPAKDRFQVG